MGAKSELRSLIEKSKIVKNSYIDGVANDLAKILEGGVRIGIRSFDHIPDYYILRCEAEKYSGLLLKIKLVYGFGIEGMVPVTDEGVNLGKRLLEESIQAVPRTR